MVANEGQVKRLQEHTYSFLGNIAESTPIERKKIPYGSGGTRTSNFSIRILALHSRVFFNVYICRFVHSHLHLLVHDAVDSTWS